MNRDDEPSEFGKLRFDLIPARGLEGAARALTVGLAKHGAAAWRSVPKEEHFAALQRHLWRWLAGDVVDADSGLSHLDLAGARVLMLRELEPDLAVFDLDEIGLVDAAPQCALSPPPAATDAATRTEKPTQPGPAPPVVAAPAERGEKFCGSCKRTKRLEDFSKNRAQPDGHQSQCRECQAQRWKSVARPPAPGARRATSPVPAPPIAQKKPPPAAAGPPSHKELLRKRMAKRKGSGYLRCKVIDDGLPCGSLQFAHAAAAHLAEEHGIELGSEDQLARFYDRVAPRNTNDDR